MSGILLSSNGKITRAELRQIPAPEATSTHQPVAHYRIVEPLKRQIETWQSHALDDDRAKLILYAAFVEGRLAAPRHLLPVVHRHYFQPEYEAFQPRTLWSLSNAFTSAFKELRTIRQFQ